MSYEKWIIHHDDGTISANYDPTCADIKNGQTWYTYPYDTKKEDIEMEPQTRNYIYMVSSESLNDYQYECVCIVTSDLDLALRDICKGRDTLSIWFKGERVITLHLTGFMLDDTIDEINYYKDEFADLVDVLVPKMVIMSDNYKKEQEEKESIRKEAKYRIEYEQYQELKKKFENK